MEAFKIEKIKELLERRAENGGAKSTSIASSNEKARAVLAQFTYDGGYTEYAVYDYTEDGLLDLSVESDSLAVAMKKYEERTEESREPSIQEG